MNTLADFAQALRTASEARALSAPDLAAAAGLSPVAVRSVLRGEAAPRLTTCMALANAVGMELVMVPKAVAEGLAAQEPADAPVLTDVARMLRDRGGGGA
jgi:ribosome-binding protein aMBF1 (putative translation factor)